MPKNKRNPGATCVFSDLKEWKMVPVFVKPRNVDYPGIMKRFNISALFFKAMI